MLTFSGVHVTQQFGAPTVRDIAVQLMRLPRFAAACDFWPVGLHSMLVAGLLPADLQIYALLHDAWEAVANDTPRPLKTQEAKNLEAVGQARIYVSLGLTPPTKGIALAVKRADLRACVAEGSVLQVPGFKDTHTNFKQDEEAEAIMTALLELAGGLQCDRLVECWNEYGFVVSEFESRIRRGLRDAGKQPNYKSE